eukprot:COSAG03_NODE_28_length_18724_cov_10.718128_8_plen_83_part_00
MNAGFASLAVETQCIRARSAARSSSLRSLQSQAACLAQAPTGTPSVVFPARNLQQISLLLGLKAFPIGKQRRRLVDPAVLGK